MVQHFCLGERGELAREVSQRRSVELVVVGLEIAKLCELLPTVVQQTDERSALIVGRLVCTDIAPLGESLVADLTEVWLFSGVPSLMCLVETA